jgi:hypothetical protein
MITATRTAGADGERTPASPSATRWPWTASGGSAAIAVAWCVGITLISYRWALRLYNREPTR